MASTHILYVHATGGYKAMTLTVNTYKSKKDLKASIGERLRYRETSFHSNQFNADGHNTVVRRPHLAGGGREFFAEVWMKNGLIERVT